MFDIGFWEMLLIGVVALVVIGPERLPEVARSAGVYVAKFRRFVAGVKSDINAELETGELKKILGDQKEQISELRNIVDTTRRELESSTSDALSTAQSSMSEAEKSFKKIQDAAAASASPASISAITGTSAGASARASGSDASEVVDREGVDREVVDSESAEGAVATHTSVSSDALNTTTSEDTSPVSDDVTGESSSSKTA